MTAQAASAPEGWVLMPRWKIERAIGILDRDGDEHGVAEDLRYLIGPDADRPAGALPVPAEASSPVSVVLTVTEIIDLAEFAGLHFDESKLPPEEERDFEYTVSESAPAGTTDDEGNVRHYAHVAWMAEYPEEGCYPLGPELQRVAEGVPS